MASLVQKITAQSLKTFSLPRRNSEFHQNFTKLRELVSRLTASDVCFDEGLVQNRQKFSPALDEAPVTYVHIWEDEVFTMGIFVMKNGSRLPLHDHPNMHGIIKVLHGNMTVRSFSIINNAVVPTDVVQRAAMTYGLRYGSRPLAVSSSHVLSVDASGESCSLSPEDGNFHEIKAADGPTAFLDILAPPYDHETGQRVCHYYDVLAPSKSAAEASMGGSPGNDVHYLYRIPQPRDFWCSSSDYLGPDPDPQLLCED